MLWTDHTDDVSARARAALDSASVVIIDTETTGFGKDAEIVEIAIIDTKGTILLDTLIRPTCPIPAKVTAIHGITDAMVVTAPTLAAMWPRIVEMLTGKEVLIYNAAYDMRLLEQSCKAVRMLPHLIWPTETLAGAKCYTCVMQWNGKKKLEGGHRALGDCLATLQLLHELAGTTNTQQEGL